jgi:hypothetical protein
MSTERELLRKACEFLGDPYLAGEDGLNLYEKIQAELAKPEPLKPKLIGYVGPNAIRALQHPGTNYDLIYRESGSGHDVAVYLGEELTCNFVQREGRCDGMIWDECTTCGSTYKNLCKLKLGNGNG